MSAGGAIMCESVPFSPVRQRKLSFPVSFHSNVISSKTFNDINASATVNLQLASKRRFSNVGDAVSRKLSTIGWRNQPVPTQEIVGQGKTLCGQYIRCRLKRSRLFTKKCGLQRLRSAVSLPEGVIVREVFPDMLRIGIELEKMYPKLYTEITKQANGGHAGGIVISEKIIRNILLSVGRSLFQNDTTWAKVVSFYAVAGGLAADCVRQNHVEFIPSIVETMGDVIEDELSGWINEVGGWIALQSYCKPDDTQISLTKIYVYIITILLSVGIFVLLVKWFGIR